jgi:hypothetical protein
VKGIYIYKGSKLKKGNDMGWNEIDEGNVVMKIYFQKLNVSIINYRTFKKNN